jgi:hypothetical protein
MIAPRPHTGGLPALNPKPWAGPRTGSPRASGPGRRHCRPGIGSDPARGQEGVRQSQILTAEGARQSAILTAEGGRQSQVLVAQGQAEAIGTVFEAIHRGRPDPQLLACQYLQTLPKLANGDGNRTWLIPGELTRALDAFAAGFGDRRTGQTSTPGPAASGEASGEAAGPPQIPPVVIPGAAGRGRRGGPALHSGRASGGHAAPRVGRRPAHRVTGT